MSAHECQGAFFLHLPATGTGSCVFTVGQGDKIGIQMLKYTGSTDVTFELYGTNWKEENIPAPFSLTGTQNSAYWSPITSVTASAFTASSAPASQNLNIYGYGMRALQVRAMSIAGGVISLRAWGKD